MKKVLKTSLMLVLLFTTTAVTAANHWVGTWGTAPQLVETNNNPPQPGLGNNSLRQIVQVSIGGETVRLKLTNEFSTSATEIKGVEIAYATTAGSSSDIDEASTVSLTFGGKPSVTMAARGKAVSDAVPFHLDARQNVAITIHYGQASSTSVSGHPGSRTTSYLKAGNTSNFSGAVKTDHWYNILALEVEAPETAGAVAILGNSITDGRGSTTNQQNRWADVLSRRLLANAATNQVGVLNMGIGGNCVLGGGLGPAAVNRYQRDLLGQEGVKWIILFEAVNDLGYAGNGVQTAKRIIDVYRQIIREAHQKGIYVFGGTITPFKGSGYYNADHEKGRSTINQWIRTTKMLDGVIDFDEAVRNPQDPEAMQSQFLFENDWLHLNAKGYETMGGCIDLNLFTKTGPLAADDEEDDYGEAIWREAESLRTGATETAGIGFALQEDAAASGGKYLLTSNDITLAAPPLDEDYLVMDFSVATAATYYIYGRVMCPTWDDDSYWIGVDGPMSSFVNGLQTNSWDWKELYKGQLTAGNHRLLIGGREDGACLDKLCITTNPEPPTGMGGSETTVAPGKLTLKAKSYFRQYGEENPTLGYDVTEGSIASGKPVVSCTATKMSPVGTYDIVIEKGSVSNEAVELVTGTLTITPAELTVSAGNYAIEEGDELPIFTPTITGFKNGEGESVLTKLPTVTTAATIGSPAGSYEVTVGGAEAQNYVFKYVNGALTVRAVEATVISVKSCERLYGDDNPEFEYTVSGPTLEGVPSLSCTATKTSPVGIYDVILGLGSVTNRKVELVNGTLTVAPAPLTVKAESYTITQGDALPNYGLSYEGFKNDDTESVLTTLPTAACDAKADNEPGEYAITVSGAVATNYEISYVEGKLTIEEKTGDEDDPSGVSAVVIDGAVFSVYDLQGRRVRCQSPSLKGLPKGVYVVNGNKLVVR